MSSITEVGLKIGISVLYCGERYEIMGIDEHKKQIAIYNAKLDLRITCEADSPHLKVIEEKEIEKENK